MRDGGDVRLPMTGEPAIGVTTPMTDKLPTQGGQIVECEYAREIGCGYFGRGGARLAAERVARIPEAHSLPKIGKVIGHTPFPRAQCRPGRRG